MLAHPFHSGAELLALATSERCSIAELMRRNERHWRSDAEIDAGLLEDLGRDAGLRRARLRERRRPAGRPQGAAPRRPMLHRLLRPPGSALRDPLTVLDWVNLYALAVNEENAAGGRVVTAPTNGAAGIVPAVLHYYRRFVPGANDDGVIDFLLTAAAIGILYKENASISGAEVGCQGEVGVACSMAAGALAAVLGGTPAQVENAAEIGMEHNLGLTCDPIGGLVQVPCIERNAMGVGQGDQRRAHGAARRRQAPRLARQGDQDDARHRRRHEGQVQGDRARRAGGQHHRVLNSSNGFVHFPVA